MGSFPGADIEVRCREPDGATDSAAAVRGWLDAVDNSGETMGAIVVPGEPGADGNLGAWPAAAAAAAGWEAPSGLSGVHASDVGNGRPLLFPSHKYIRSRLLVVIVTGNRFRFEQRRVQRG